jgi:mannose-6-phosphate isomerase-like protein (cupin superfamily)
VPTLSKVENGRLSLSYDKLVRLSEGLEIDIAQLFAGGDLTEESAAITGRRSINRNGDGELVSTRNYEYRYLNTDVVRKSFIPILAEPHATSIEEFGDLVKHSGEEFVYVLEGEVEVHTALYAPFVLKAGESAYIDSSMGHAYVSRGPGRCKLLAVCSAAETHLRETIEKTRSVEGEVSRPAVAGNARRSRKLKRHK